MNKQGDIVIEPLLAGEFAPFGEVIEPSDQPSRCFFNEALENTREHAHVDLSVARIPPLVLQPLQVKVMERHPCSSQTFIPIKVARYLVIVAPNHPDDVPDVNGVRIFLAQGSQGITYRRGVWHHGMTVLDEVADMAVLMWCDGGEGDEEFIDLSEPFDVVVPNRDQQ